MKTLMERKYSDEELIDLEQHIYDVINESHDLPVDEYGFRIGTFRVQISWENDSE